MTEIDRPITDMMQRIFVRSQSTHVQDLMTPNFKLKLFEVCSIHPVPCFDMTDNPYLIIVEQSQIDIVNLKTQMKITIAPTYFERAI